MNDKRIIQLLDDQDFYDRFERIKHVMSDSGLDSMLIGGNANLFYLTGRVFFFYFFISTSTTGPLYFVRRPNDLAGDNIFFIRKPEDIPGELSAAGIDAGRHIGLETDTTSYTMCRRLMKAFGMSEAGNADAVLRTVRSVKTGREIELIAESGIKQEGVYREIPSLYRSGMTDIDLQIEIEYLSRQRGCLGQFRISGDSMELFMGNILAGDNADTPTPYDFAMGGGGQHPSLPVGANGTVITDGMSVMVDCNGNFNGYMTDMTRVFSTSEVSQLALEAHDCSREICRKLAEAGQPGVPARMLYEQALEIVRSHGLEAFFMGHRQHAGFIGHGVGIEINEMPVIAPRSRDVLEVGNVIALEPKFVIPGTGAVGIENTYVVCGAGPMRCLTNAPEEIIRL